MKMKIAKNTVYLRRALVVFLLLLGIFLNRSLFVKKEVVVSFNQKAVKEVEYQVFYTEYSNSYYSKEKSFKKIISPKVENVKLVLPFSNTLKKFHLDVVNYPQTIKISDFKIDGKPLDLNKFTARKDVKEVKMENNELVLKSVSKIPFVAYDNDLNIEKSFSVNYKVLFVVFCFYILLAYVLTVKQRSLKTVMLAFGGTFCLAPLLQLYTYSLNLVVPCLVLFLCGCYLIIVFSKKTFDPCSFFITSGAFLSLIYLILLLPPAPCDAYTHMAASYRFSSLVLNKGEGRNWIGRKEDVDFYKKMWQMVWDSSNLCYRDPVSADYKLLVKDISLFVHENAMEEMPMKEDRMKFYSVISYLPLSSGLIMGRILHLSPFFTVYLARILLLLCYILALAHAVKKTPIGKNIIALTALFPMALVMSNAFSYDGMVILSSLSFIASIFSFKFAKTRSSLYVCMFWAFIIGGVKGGGYLLLLPLTFMLIKRGSWENAKEVFLICISGIFSVFLFDVVFAPKEEFFELGKVGTGNMVFEDALYHPFTYLKLTLNTYWLYGKGLLKGLVGTYLTWGGERALPAFVPWIFLLIAGITSVFEQAKQYMVSKRDCLIMLVVVFLVLFALPSMLLLCTPVKSTFIRGLQGRYYLPISPLILIVISYSVRNFISDGIIAKYRETVRCWCYQAFAVLSVLTVYYLLKLYLTR